MKKAIDNFINQKQVLASKYQINRKLKTGGFGSVYIARGVNPDNNKYAVKLMPKKYERYAKIQLQIYDYIKEKQFTLGFIKHYDYGIIDQQLFLVMELIGLDLEQVMLKMKQKRFSTKTVLMIGLQVIDRIQALHLIGYVHRDIKPDNLAIGSKQKNNLIYLFDFGLSIKNNEPLPNQQKGKMIGTLGFMSLRCHDGKKATFLDDIESFVYTLVYMIMGSLPWMHINVQSVADYQRIKILKQKMDKNWFKRNQIPLKIYEILEISRNGDTKEKIDYLNIKYKLISCLHELNFQNDFNFDWCGKLKIAHEDDSPRKRTEEKKKLNLLNQSNQKIVQNQIYEIYKFINEDNKDKQEQTGSYIKKKGVVEVKQKNERLQQQGDKKQEKNKKKQIKRPFSANPNRPQEKNEKNKIIKQIENKLKQIGQISYEGPRIVINRTTQYRL